MTQVDQGTLWTEQSTSSVWPVVENCSILLISTIHFQSMLALHEIKSVNSVSSVTLQKTKDLIPTKGNTRMLSFPASFFPRYNFPWGMSTTLRFTQDIFSHNYKITQHASSQTDKTGIYEIFPLISFSYSRRKIDLMHGCQLKISQSILFFYLYLPLLVMVQARFLSPL